MAIPKYNEFMKPFLEALADGNMHTKKEVKQYMINQFCFTESDLAELLPSGRQTVFSNRVGWAGTYLKKAGLIDSPARACFVITPEGQAVLKQKPQQIDSNYLMQYESFRQFAGASEEERTLEEAVQTEQATPDDIFEDAFKQINANLADELLNEVMKLSPTAFERMILDLMRKMGYGTFENAAATTAVTGDEGIDGVIMEDKLGFDLIYIQAKQWDMAHSVGRPEVQAFVGAIAGKGGKGLFVTTSKFSAPAIAYAKNQHVILIDGEKLTQYMIEFNFGVNVKKTFEIKSIDTDIFNDYADE